MTVDACGTAAWGGILALPLERLLSIIVLVRRMAASNFRERRQRVATRPSCRRVHRRKAASEIPMPGSGRSSPSVPDPEEPFVLKVNEGQLTTIERPYTIWRLCLLSIQTMRVRRL